MRKFESETRHIGAEGDQRVLRRRNLAFSMTNRRIPSLLLYTTATLLLAVGASIVFNGMELDSNFAIAIIGSLIGGFLGALLAVALIVDIYSPQDDQNPG
jgi:uncharacterized YccA/Bax inhibitor family protein